MSKKHLTDIENQSIEDDETPREASHPEAGKSHTTGMVMPRHNIKEQHITFALVLRELRAHHFAVLSSVDESGAADSAGVNYGVSASGQTLTLYVMTRRHLKK